MRMPCVDRVPRRRSRVLQLRQPGPATKTNSTTITPTYSYGLTGQVITDALGNLCIFPPTIRVCWPKSRSACPNHFELDNNGNPVQSTAGARLPRRMIPRQPDQCVDGWEYAPVRLLIKYGHANQHDDARGIKTTYVAIAIATIDHYPDGTTEQYQYDPAALLNRPTGWASRHRTLTIPTLC